MIQIMPRLIEISHLRRMRVDVLNMMRLFTSRFPVIYRFPLIRSIMAPKTPHLIVALISVLMLIIPTLNSVMIFLLISFASSPHSSIFYSNSQIHSAYSFITEIMSSYGIWSWGACSTLDARGFLGGSTEGGLA